MSVTRLTIAPIELYTPRVANMAKIWLLQNIALEEVRDSNFINIMNEVLGAKVSSYTLPSGARLILYGTSMCLVYEDAEDIKESISNSVIKGELKSRSERHNRLQDPSKNEELFSLLSGLNKHCKKKPDNIQLHYVFGFTVISEAGKSPANEKLYKILAEPSILDLDDMKSSNPISLDAANISDLNDDIVSHITDVDISSQVKTYITWATIVSVTSSDASHQHTKALLLALEIHLQSIWNRCYTFGKFADSVLSESRQVKQFEDLYWNFSSALDEASAISGSTVSSRASRLYKEMVYTSNLENESRKLRTKLKLLDRYSKDKKQRGDRVFQKTTEGLLFVAAVSSVAQVVLPIPILENSWIAFGILGILSVAGILSITLSR